MFSARCFTQNGNPRDVLLVIRSVLILECSWLSHGMKAFFNRCWLSMCTLIKVL